MLLSLNQMRGWHIRASDGAKGRASDVLFDDHAWTVRYLVDDTGWLFGRKVLLAPEAIEVVDAQGGEILVTLTKKQIEEGPGLGSDLPVSRQEELALREHYDWPRYWEPFPGGVGMAPLIPALELHRPALAEDPPTGVRETVRERSDPHLRSGRELEGYHIEATDGEIGHVEDLVFDDEAWGVRYIVVDTGNWLSGRKVVVAPRWAEGIDWSGRLLRVGVERKAVENSPPFDLTKPMVRDYETEIHEHYGRDPYWA